MARDKDTDSSSVLQYSTVLNKLIMNFAITHSFTFTGLAAAVAVGRGSRRHSRRSSRRTRISRPSCLRSHRTILGMVPTAAVGAEVAPGSRPRSAAAGAGLSVATCIS